MAAWEDYINQLGQKTANSIGGVSGVTPSQPVAIPSNTKQDLGNYWRQNVSTPSDIPAQASPVAHLDPLIQNIDPHMIQNPPKRFENLKNKIQIQEPISKDDIRSAISPTEALSPDDEEKVNKQLQEEK